MAKILLGPALSDARGALGGMVFTKGRSGAILRTKKIPTLSATALQLHLRGAAVTFAKKWDNTLTPTQRAGWLALALLHGRLNAFGQTYYLTGFQLFMSSNQARKQVGLPEIDTAPGSYSAGSPTAITLSWTSPAGPLTLDAPVEPGLHDVPAIWVTPQVLAGRASTKGARRFLVSLAAATSGPWDITAAYTARFGAFILGRAINFLLRYTDDVSGCQGVAAVNQQFLS